MTGPDYLQRRTRLVRQLKSLPINSLLISSDCNVRYLTGFTGDSSWLFVSPDGAVMLSDTRYQTQLTEECPDLQVRIRDAGRTMMDNVRDVLTTADFHPVGIESGHVSLADYQELTERNPGVEFCGIRGVVEKLRELKDKWELRQIREAIRYAERGMVVVRSLLRPELTERQIRCLLEQAMRDFGAEGVAFEPIVGVGATAALPHARSGSRPVSEHPALLIDWGAQTLSGYRSDLTRVLFTGRPTRQMQRVYDIVLKAQQAAIEAIRPGMLCRDVDQIARQLIADAGYSKQFGHGLGHGFGLEIHESPRLSPISEQKLEPGMVVTVEPGIYIPGKFGVRIEDDILVTADGHEVMSTVPREFEQSILWDLA